MYMVEPPYHQPWYERVRLAMAQATGCDSPGRANWACHGAFSFSEQHGERHN